MYTVPTEEVLCLRRNLPMGLKAGGSTIPLPGAVSNSENKNES